MTDELEDLEQQEAIAEEEEDGGHGFILGLALGTLAGAAAATLFAPATGEELLQQYAEETVPDGAPQAQASGGMETDKPVERVRAMLARVRSRVNDAAEEGREATQEAQAASRERYAHLTSTEEPAP